MKIRSIDYKNQIFSFALQAKELFDHSKEKRVSDDYDKELYEEFWSEYNQLLNRNMNL
ncbi:DNA polymerase IV [Metabacillus indicus]|uniref:DNA polymerase IV n=1 Tax=Metabacillus indicus TaxID=246786 RepID=UPI002492FCE8|nr:DNA polymerase IV [Metabacillus indicus]